MMSADSFKDALIAEIPNLRAFAASLSGSVTLADDVVQDTDGMYAGRLAVAGDQVSHLELADFRKALAKLPPEQREALTMIGATGLSYEEAAEICGVAIGTIKSRLNRARTKLAELLSAEGLEGTRWESRVSEAHNARRSNER